MSEIERVIGIDAQAAAGPEPEPTESLIMEDIKHSFAGLQAISALGVTIASDDFGTGFSSLGYLARLPVDTLKLKAVAEGVEAEERSRLPLDCDEMQGFLFSKPAPREIFETQLVTRPAPGNGVIRGARPALEAA